MDRNLRHGLTSLAGIALLGAAAAVHFIYLEGAVVVALLSVIGVVLAIGGAIPLRAEIAGLFRGRRGEIVLFTVGAVCVLVALAYLSIRFPIRFDMTAGGHFSLSEQTIHMLKRLEKPVRITFFHDPMMREAVELYQFIASKSDGKVTLEFSDPMLNPAHARLRGVEFAGTAILESEGRTLRINGPAETDIANGILRVSQGVQRIVCFLDGHGEPDPFSLESHDHLEGGSGGHSHGLGAKFVLHERHGMAKARQSLESMNYTVEKMSPVGGQGDFSRCIVLVVAGPKTSLLPEEVKAIQGYLAEGGNGFFMLDPFIETGLESTIREYGIVLDDTIVIDPASHFWTDVSAPAVTDYNRHDVTRDLPLTFFPGARSLSPTGERVLHSSVRPIVNASKKSFGQTHRERVEFDPTKDKAGPATLMAIAVRRGESTPSAEMVLRGLQGKPMVADSTDNAKDATRPPSKPSRIAVVGDSDFATNSFFHIMGNGKLFLNTINYLAARENLIGIEPRTYDIPRVNLTNRQMKGTFFLSIILVPALMALVGIAVWWRQR
ncbi:MAG: GldG family protein [Burkholderiales bacterium]